MPVVAVLAAMVSFGSCDGLPTTWTVTYRDGVVWDYTSPMDRLDLEPRPGRCFTVAAASCPQSLDACAEPLLGDADLDGTVGLSDYLAVGQHWGEHAP